MCVGVGSLNRGWNCQSSFILEVGEEFQSSGKGGIVPSKVPAIERCHHVCPRTLPQVFEQVLDSVKGGQPLAGTLFPVALQTLGSLVPSDSPAVHLPAPPAKPRTADGSGGGAAASRVPRLKHPAGPRPGIVVLTPTASPNPSPEKPPRPAAPRALASSADVDAASPVLDGDAAEAAAEARGRGGPRRRALDFGDDATGPSDAGGAAASAVPGYEGKALKAEASPPPGPGAPDPEVPTEPTGLCEEPEAESAAGDSISQASEEPTTSRVPSAEAASSGPASSCGSEAGTSADGDESSGPGCGDPRHPEPESLNPSERGESPADPDGVLPVPEDGMWEYPTPQGPTARAPIGPEARERQQAESEASLLALITEHAGMLHSLNSGSGSGCSVM